jgi:G3E family GTPase
VAEEIEDDRHHNRHLEEDGLQHNHHHHDHDHHHHNEHDDHGLDGNDLSGSFENLRKSLRGRGTDVSRQEGNMGYSYQVDMYIEFDQQLVTNNGGLQGAHNYINALFTMANTIYERE